MTHASLVLSLQSYRWRNDDGSESAATWLAATNVTPVVDVGILRLRYLIQETGGGTSSNTSFQLEYSKNEGAYADVTGSSSNVRSVASTHVTDGGNTTQQIGSGTFLTSNAGIDEVDGVAASVSFAGNDEVEVEFVIDLRSADLSDGDLVSFRLIEVGVGQVPEDADAGIVINIPSAQTGIVFEEAVSAFDTSVASLALPQISGGTDQTYIAIVAIRDTETISSISGGGLTWTKIKNQTSGRSQVSIEAWKAVGSPSAFSPSITLSATAVTIEAVVHRISGVDQTTPTEDGVGHNTNGENGATTGGTDDTTNTVTTGSTNANSVHVAAFNVRDGKVSTPDVDYLLRFYQEMQDDLGGGRTDLYVYGYTKAATGDDTHTGTLSLAKDWVGVGFVLIPASITIQLEADVVGAATLTADISLTSALKADVTGANTNTADLAIAQDLAADVGSTSALTADLSMTIGLASDVVATAAITADLTIKQDLASDVVGATVIAADLTRGVALASDVVATSALSADLSVTLGLESDISAVSTITADLSHTIALAAAVVSVSALTADLTHTVALAADIVASSAITADLTLIGGLEADITASSTLSAALTIKQALQANFSATALLAADLTLITRLQAAVLGQAAISATLSVDTINRIYYIQAQTIVRYPATSDSTSQFNAATSVAQVRQATSTVIGLKHTRIQSITLFTSSYEVIAIMPPTHFTDGYVDIRITFTEEDQTTVSDPNVLITFRIRQYEAETPTEYTYDPVGTQDPVFTEEEVGIYLVSVPLTLEGTHYWEFSGEWDTPYTQIAVGELEVDTPKARSN